MPRTLVPFSDRDVTQVFVSKCAVTRENDGSLVASGTVEIALRGLDGGAAGPAVTMGLNVPVEATTTLEEFPKLLIARASELIKRIAQESVEDLVKKEALSFDDKFKGADSND